MTDQPPADTANMPTLFASYLIEHAINTVDRNHEPGDQPCCSNCCGPCHAVIGLAESGQLDRILAERGPGYDWWDDVTGTVKRDYLAERIRPYCEMGDMSNPERCTELATPDPADGFPIA